MNLENQRAGSKRQEASSLLFVVQINEFSEDDDNKHRESDENMKGILLREF